LEQHRWGFLRHREPRRRVAAALALLAHPEIRPQTPVHRLSPGACQLVEVAPALVTSARVIVFDEPTSSLTRRDTEHLFDLTLRSGECRGVFGLVGAGRTEMLRTLFGLAPVRAGEVWLRGLPCTRATPAERIAAGVGLLSEDRKGEGLALTQSVADNLTYS